MAEEETQQKTIQVEEVITVGDLAAKLDIPATSLIAELMKNGVMATVNEKIDFDTAQIVTAEIDCMDFRVMLKNGWRLVRADGIEIPQPS